jgi:hypothetical protein
MEMSVGIPLRSGQYRSAPPQDTCPQVRKRTGNNGGSTPKYTNAGYHTRAATQCTSITIKHTWVDDVLFHGQ